MFRIGRNAERHQENAENSRCARDSARHILVVCGRLRRATMAIDFAIVKASPQQTWDTGDDAQVGNALVIMRELLRETVDFRAGHPPPGDSVR
jgi:hypothetical protein